jgi:hypothetical protein
MFYNIDNIDLFTEKVDISKDDVEINSDDKTIKFLNPPPQLQQYKYIRNVDSTINNTLEFIESDKASYDNYLDSDKDLELFYIRFIHTYSLDDALEFYARYPNNYIFFILDSLDLSSSELNLKIAVFIKYKHNELDAVLKLYRVLYQDLYYNAGSNIDRFKMTLEHIDNFRFMVIDAGIKSNSINILDNCYNITSTIIVNDINLSIE